MKGPPSSARRAGHALAGALALAGFLAAGARGAAPSPGPGPGPGPGAPLVVFAAASLSDAFAELGRLYERRHPGARVEFSFAGSQQLAMQLDQGARADVFAPADAGWMDFARARGVVAGAALPLAENRLVVIVPQADPGRIGRLQDLARPGVKLVMGAPAVPAGRYARQALERLARLPGFPSDFARRALANVVSQEENVRAVVGKVQLGEADAGLVYRSDVAGAAHRAVRVLEIPEAGNVRAVYPIAVLKGSARADAARAFVALALSPEGQGVLARHGLLPARGAPR